MGASRSRMDQARNNANAGNGAGALTNLYNKMSQGGTYGGQQSMTGGPSSWGYDGAVRQGKGGNGSTTPGAQTGGTYGTATTTPNLMADPTAVATRLFAGTRGDEHEGNAYRAQKYTAPLGYTNPTARSRQGK